WTKVSEFDWNNIFDEVDAACKALFGFRMQDEIAGDIASDEKMLSLYKSTNSPKIPQSDKFDPIWPFEELILRRKEFFNLFVADSEQFISPVKFLQMMTISRLPRVVFEYPHGVDPDDRRGHEWQPIYDRTWRTIDNSDTHVIYSFQRLYDDASWR